MKCPLRFATINFVCILDTTTSIQPCVEVTFLAIFSEFQQTVRSIVMDMLSKVQGSSFAVGVFSP